MEEYEEDITILAGSDNDTDSDFTILHNEENDTDSNTSVPYMVPNQNRQVQDEIDYDEGDLRIVFIFNVMAYLPLCLHVYKCR